MKKAALAAVGCLLTMVAGPEARAQWNVARFGTEPNHVYTSFGLDPALVTTVGYSRVVPMRGHRFQLAGDAGIVTAKLDSRDFRVRLQVFTTLLRWRSLYLNGSATSNIRGTRNSIYSGINFGADLTAHVGVYRPRWFAAGEFGKDKAVITHVTHSRWYREVLYPEARDGWYLDAGGTFHYGLAGGVTAGRTEWLLRAGFQQTEDFNGLTPPAYAGLGFGVGF